MKLTLEFGRKGSRAAGARQEALEEAVKALAEKLQAERHKNNYLLKQNEHLVAELNRFLRARAERWEAVTQEMPVVTTVKAAPARFQLVDGRVEP